MEIPKKITSVKLDKLSYVAIPLKMLSQTDNELATCTGFIYQKNSQHYLITNWHCFSGKNPETKRPLKGSFVLPAKVQVPFHKTKEPCISWERHNFDLIDNATSPKWLIHPKYRQGVDVVALEIIVPEDVFIHPINQQDFENFDPLIADDVFILGFPYNFKGGGNFPIWKRASIATEPTIDYNLTPQILVDTASREGMSGAPVVFRRDGIHGLVNGVLKDDTIFGEIQNFIGIYSGRYTGDTDFDAQLGIVWKKSVIDEIISGNEIDTI